MKMLTKVLGWGCLACGVGLVIFFPYIPGYQPPSVTNAGVLIGIALIAMGLFLLRI